jgi:hypothetical protein
VFSFHVHGHGTYCTVDQKSLEGKLQGIRLIFNIVERALTLLE